MILKKDLIILCNDNFSLLKNNTQNLLLTWERILALLSIILKSTFRYNKKMMTHISPYRYRKLT